MQFKIGDLVVHPAFGMGNIVKIEEKQFSKKSAARLYYRARQLCKGQDVAPVIIPVGRHYDNKTAFRSNALVEFHPPLHVPSALLDPIDEDDRETFRARASELTSVLEPVLQEVTHATESWELNQMMNRVRSLMRAPSLRGVPSKRHW